MNKKVLNIIFVIIVLSVIGFYKYREYHWFEYRSRDGSYSISFPVKPVIEEQSVPLNNFIIPGERSYTNFNDGMACMVTKLDYPDVLINRLNFKGMLEGSINDTMFMFKCEAISQKSTFFKGYQTLEVTGESDKMYVQTKTLIAGSTVYMVSALYLKASISDKKITKYFDSFQPHILKP